MFSVVGVDIDSNWELLSPEGTGVRFFLPGGVGPAGHDDVSLSFMTSSVPSCPLPNFKFEALECPYLLRAGLSDLFSSSEVLSSSTMTVIKILSKKSLQSASDQDMEQISKQFVCLAEAICENLKGAGYWADFINPFSGSARYSNGTHHFYGEDAITCLKSTTEDNGFCKVINTGLKQTRSKYVGSLYTTAPRSTNVIQDVLKTNKS